MLPTNQESYSGWVQNQIKDLDKILLNNIGYKEDGYFVEVGAFDCRQWSPCYPLSMLGWSGIFFEPQLDLYYKCRQIHAGNPNVTTVNKAISNSCGKAMLTLGGSLSTIKEDTVDLYLSIPELAFTGLANRQTEEVLVSTLNVELEACEAPVGFDLLSIDVEGSELDVLYGFSIDVWCPTLVIVEARELFWDSRISNKAIPINAYMADAGYRKIYCDHINSVFVR